jgi:zinc transport system ATP-binding protein
VSLSVYPNQILSIIGPNGAGKSTLVKILLGLLRPTEGQCATKIGLTIGYMPQQMDLSPLLPMTVQHFLAQVPGVSKVERLAILGELHIEHLVHVPLIQLSGGEWQRVLLARALLRNPHVLVMDEPTQGMDLQGQALFFHLIARLREERGCAIVIITHDLHYVMAKTDQVVCLNQHICCQGHPEVVKQTPEFLALYRHEHDHDHK